MVSTAEGGTITIGLRLARLWTFSITAVETAFLETGSPHQKPLGSNVADPPMWPGTLLDSPD
jgi:hypothetical protein